MVAVAVVYVTPSFACTISYSFGIEIEEREREGQIKRWRKRLTLDEVALRGVSSSSFGCTGIVDVYFSYVYVVMSICCLFDWFG